MLKQYLSCQTLGSPILLFMNKGQEKYPSPVQLICITNREGLGFLGFSGKNLQVQEALVHLIPKEPTQPERLKPATVCSGPCLRPEAEPAEAMLWQRSTPVFCTATEGCT